MKANEAAVPNAVGIKAVGLIVRNMQSGYGKPIRKTGDLMRDVSFEQVDEKTVNVGNTLDYSLFVHEGTRKMGARHYITDAITSKTGIKALQETFEKYLKKGFE
jgi:hypothetical protein